MSWFNRLLHRRRLERQLDAELQFHFDEYVQEQTGNGVSETEARREARLIFGGVEQLKEDCRDARGTEWFVDLGRDFRAAVRYLTAAPAFTSGAVLVIALSIGASTAIFSVVDAVALRRLPFDDSDRLVAVGERMRGQPTPRAPQADPDAITTAAPQNYLDWIARQRAFESVAATASGWLTLLVPGTAAESLVPQRVTASFFHTLRIRPAIGRAFTKDDETTGGVVILSDELWRRRFGADPAILGRLIPIEELERDASSPEGRGYQVVGVMPPGFAFPVPNPRPITVWLPLVLPANHRVRTPGMIVRYLQVVARLAPGVSLADAQRQMDGIAADLEQENPVWNKNSVIGVRPLLDHVVGAQVRSWMLLLLGAVCAVVLIGGANVASLVLARTTAREHEIGIRFALGASRWRVARQFLTENLVLAAVGGLGGLLVAWLGVHVLRSTMPGGIPRVMTIALNMRVLLAGAGICIATGVACALLPVLSLSRAAGANAVRAGVRTTSGSARRRTRQALVAAEIALAFVLLVGGSLFVKSFMSLLDVDLGFDPRGVVTMQISPASDRNGNATDTSPAAFSEILERSSHVPGVLEVAMSDGAPLVGPFGTSTAILPAAASDPAAGRSAVRRWVTPAYYRALGIPLRKGRPFDERDVRSPDVAILNEVAVRQLFGDRDPLGQSVRFRGDRIVVGVVADARQGGLETEARPEIYVPLTPQDAAGGVLLVVRTAGDLSAVLPAIRAVVTSVLPEVPVRTVYPMEARVAEALAQRKITMLLVSLFGLLGLAIAVVGLYSVMAHVVAERTREIGVRMALGASRTQVLTMVLRNASAVLIMGLTIGGAVALYCTRLLPATSLFRTESADPSAFIVAGISLSIAALAASSGPAFRAARIDPVLSLRAE